MKDRVRLGLSLYVIESMLILKANKRVDKIFSVNL